MSLVSFELFNAKYCPNKNTNLLVKTICPQKKSVGKIFRQQKISSVKNIRHQGKNLSPFTNGFFTDQVANQSTLKAHVIEITKACLVEFMKARSSLVV